MSESDSGPPPAGAISSGSDARGELRVPAEPAYLALIGSVLRWFGNRAGLSDEQCRDFEVALDEACTNVVRYAFAGEARGQMAVTFCPDAGGLTVEVRDQGRPFDPKEGARIAEQKQAQDPASGGMGLRLMRQLADAVHYRRDEREGNCLTLTKYKTGRSHDGRRGTHE